MDSEEPDIPPANRETVYPSPGYSFCFQMTLDRRLHYNRHYHGEYEFAVCRSGSGEAYIGDVVLSFKSPAAFFISPKTAHTLVSRENFDGWIIQIPPIILDRYEGRPEFHFLVELIRKSSPALRFSEQCSARIIPALEKAQAQSGFFRWTALLEALHAASEDRQARVCSFRRGRDKAQEEDRLNTIISSIFTHAAEPYRLTSLAADANMSVPSFCRRFKKRTGMSFVEYLHSIRINTAKKLLQQSKMYVDDICYECGFNSVSFFNRKFKEHTGMTPVEYRQRFGADFHEAGGR
ncbi:MAG: AraC family transcriptional regulator [Treponema sp.]|jgi:AraC-like DNA-binding protein|nr:AraC family transcriptional regulator [Treponema sp.]